MHLGILGVLIGTFISNVLTNVWWEPQVVFKYGFKISSVEYFILLLRDIIIFVLNIIIVNKICVLFNYSNIGQIIINLIVALIISLLMFSIIYCKNKEFKYSINLIKNIFVKK